MLTRSLPSSIGKGHLCGTLRPKAGRQRRRKHTHSKKTKHKRQERKVPSEPGMKVFSCKAKARKLRQGNLGFEANLGYSEFQASLGYMNSESLSEVNSGGKSKPKETHSAGQRAGGPRKAP